MGNIAKTVYFRLILPVRSSLAKRIGSSGSVTLGDMMAFIIAQVGLVLALISTAYSFANPSFSLFWIRTAFLGSAIWLIGVALLGWGALNRVRGLKPLKLDGGPQVLKQSKTPLKLVDLRAQRKRTLKRSDLRKILRESKWG